MGRQRTSSVCLHIDRWRGNCTRLFIVDERIIIQTNQTPQQPRHHCPPEDLSSVTPPVIVTNLGRGIVRVILGIVSQIPEIVHQTLGIVEVVVRTGLHRFTIDSETVNDRSESG